MLDIEAKVNSIKLKLKGNILYIERTNKKQTLKAIRLQPIDKKDQGQNISKSIVSVYYNKEYNSVFIVSSKYSALYGLFNSFLRRRPIQTIKQIRTN